MTDATRLRLLYHFGRLRRPALTVPFDVYERHLRRAFGLVRGKTARAGGRADRTAFLAGLYADDWLLAVACLEGLPAAWDALFASRTSRADGLLVDALRARAVRLFPRDPDRQENAVAEFWGYLLAGEADGALPILARYDGQRPLVPWLIRVFQNRQITLLRQERGQRTLVDEDQDVPWPDDTGEDARWHEEFRTAAREWLAGLGDQELLLLGLRLRYRLSQRQVAGVLGIHEGNVSRQIGKLRDRCLDHVGRRLAEAGWTGDDLGGFVLKEMDGLLLDEPRLAAEPLAALLARRGMAPPPRAV